MIRHLVGWGIVGIVVAIIAAGVWLYLTDDPSPKGGHRE